MTHSQQPRLTNCAYCQDRVVQNPLGRPRLYCSNRCRQRAKDTRLAQVHSRVDALEARLDILEASVEDKTR